MGWRASTSFVASIVTTACLAPDLVPVQAAVQAAAPTDPSPWHDALGVKAAIDELAGAHKDLARVDSYGRSLGGRDLWYVELGPIHDPQKARLPALLVVAGLDGQHLVGTELVLDELKRLVEGYGGEDKAITKLLDDHVVYLIPRANPDGAEAWFKPAGGARREVRGNLRPVDEDRDGTIDEDGPEDLNHDGVITQMRWKDPAGTWIEDPTDPRIVRPADPWKGERGVFKVRTEGLDRDGDGEWAEDGIGDVVPDRNFPQRWPEHEPGAGRVPMSEPEALALGQFVFERPAIALAVVYGLHDNVAIDAKPDAGGDGGPAAGAQSFRFSRSMPGGIVKEDQPLYAELATRYRAASGVTSKPAVDNDDGAFWAWSYFQLGVPTLCMHVWSPPLDVQPPAPPGGEGEAKDGKDAKKEGKEGEEKKDGDEKKDEAKKDDAAKAAGGEPAKPADAPQSPPPQQQPPTTPPQSQPTGGGQGGGGAGGGGRRGGRRGGGPGGGPGGPGGAGGDAKPAETPAANPDEKKLLVWNDQKMGGAAFVPWTKVTHPTLGEVEVGGWKPYVRVNPPPAEVAELAKKHSDFVVKLGELFAQVKLAEITVERLGEGLYRINATVVNDGWLPTATAMGERNRRARPTRLDLEPGTATVVQGEKRHTWSRIEGGGGRRELHWVVASPAGGEVTLKLWSERAGDDERLVPLK